MAKEYSLKILAWKKYQGREVKTRSSWLRFENNFIESPNFSEFSSDERVVWVYALCCASKLNTDILQVPHQCSHRVLHRCTGIDENTFHRTFEKLKKLQLVEIRTTRGRYADDTFANADDTRTTHYEDETRRNETRRDEDETKYSCSERGKPVTEPNPELFTESTQDILEGIKREVQDAWLATYQDSGWIRLELSKSWAWIKANPQKAPKANRARFVTNWLSRGWESYRKSLTSNPVRPSTLELLGAG